MSWTLEFITRWLVSGLAVVLVGLILIEVTA